MFSDPLLYLYIYRFGFALLHALPKRSIRLNATLCQHGIGHLHESCDIRTLHIVYISVGLGSVFNTCRMDILHDRMQFLVNLFGSPHQTDRVLSHLKTRSGYTTCIRSLTRRVEQFMFLEDCDCFRSRRHVRTLGNTDTTVVDQSLSLLAVQLVLSSARQSDIALHAPRTFARIVGLLRDTSLHTL